VKRTHLYILTASLTLAAIAFFIYKVWLLGVPLTPGTLVNVWEIETHIAFDPGKGPVKVQLNLPRNSKRFSILNENFVSRGFGTNINTDGGNRKIMWSKRRVSGRNGLYYRATIATAPKAGSDKPVKVARPEPVKPEFAGARLEAAQSVVTDTHEESSDEESFTLTLLKRLSASPPADAIAALAAAYKTPAKRVELAVQLLALAGIPSRAVHGIRLEPRKRDAKLVHWLEIYSQGWWQAYDPQAVRTGIPEDYFALWTGFEPLFSADGTRNLTIEISVMAQEAATYESTLGLGAPAAHPLYRFSLQRLPITTQAVYRVLLVVPIGVFLLVLLRNVVGLRTIGTFMPVLIALAFRETQLVWGLTMFVLLVGSGLVARLYLEHLKLLVVPRLGAIVIVVIFLMLIFSILTHLMGFERGISVALFPMVIMTMTIERMSIVWDELGAATALRQASGTLVVAVACYLVMTREIVEHLMFHFPELMLVLLAATLLLGRYTGYRLMELKRFRAMVEASDETR